MDVGTTVVALRQEESFVPSIANDNINRTGVQIARQERYTIKVS